MSSQLEAEFSYPLQEDFFYRDIFKMRGSCNLIVVRFGEPLVVLMLGLGFTLCRSHPCSSLATCGPSLGGLPESCSGLLSLLLKGHLYRKPFVSTRDTLFTNSLFSLMYLIETASSTILLSMGFHINFSSNTESLSYTITSSFRRL